MVSDTPVSALSPDIGKDHKGGILGKKTNNTTNKGNAGRTSKLSVLSLFVGVCSSLSFKAINPIKVAKNTGSPISTTPISCLNKKAVANINNDKLSKIYPSRRL